MPGVTESRVAGVVGAAIGVWPTVVLAVVVACVAGLVLLVGVRVARSRHHFWLAVWAVLNGIWARVLYRLRRVGPCTVPVTGPVIVVANHTSAADPLMVIGACYENRVPSYMVAREFTQVPLFRYFTELINCIPVRRDGLDTDATKAALRHLREGGALGVFIEGRVVKPGETPTPKDGPALLALRTGATVVPVHISGTKYCESVLRSFFRWHRARVRFGHPVHFGALVGRRDRASTRKGTALIDDAILRLAPPDGD